MINNDSENTQKKSAKAALLTIAVNFCRIVIGAVFVFSGFVKAIDPLGTQYKIEDYLGAVAQAVSMPDMITLTASVALAALEFSLGVMMIFAIQRRLVSKLVLAFMVLMTIITVWIAVFNPVRDCGCFGDAIHLTNVETLMKNIVLLAMAIAVAWQPMRMYRFLSPSTQWIAVNYTILFVLALSVFCLYYLPIFDFRPYHIGVNIKQAMTIPEGAPQPEFETTFIMQKNGEKREFSLEDYPDSTWQFVDSKTVQTKEGFLPPIHDFSIQTADSEDITDSVLTCKGYVFLLIAPHLEQASDANFGTIDRIYEYCEEYDVPFYCLTASGEKAIAHWQNITGAEYPFRITDETTLKTIVRSNPGLLLLKDGTIIQKWSHNDLPAIEELTGPLDKTSIGSLPDDGPAYKLAKVTLWFFLPLILLVMADRTWAWSKYLRRRKKKNTI